MQAAHEVLVPSATLLRGGAPPQMKESATLFACKVVRERKEQGLPVFNFGLGACPLPAADFLVKRLQECAHLKEYTDVTGIPELKRKLLDVYSSCKFTLVGNGVKPMLFWLFYHWPKRIVIVTPAWVSYIAQIKIAKKHHILIETSMEDQYKLTPDVASQSLRSGDLVVFTHPNNPSGGVYTKSELEALAEVFRKSQVTVIADEIYLKLSYQPAVSIGDFYPEHTIRTSSLSKAVGCGGWRCGWMVFPPLEVHITF